VTNSVTREEILKLFHCRQGEFVSGEEISQALQISRSAVWKQIQGLRELGYLIEAVTARGYRLRSSPDSLRPEALLVGLETRFIGREQIYLENADSTNVRAFDLAEKGAVEGTVVIAEQQTAGKGRMGRRWESPAGVNLYCSVVLRPPILPRDAPHLTFVSAVAVARAMNETGRVKADLKWPNDILINGRKVAGLLNEMSSETEGIHFVILGVGANLNMTADQFPADLRYPATSVLIAGGRPISRSCFTRSFFHHLEELYQLYLDEGFTPVRHAWEDLCPLHGKRLQVSQGEKITTGTMAGLDNDGALLLQTQEGTIVRILTGDVRPLDINFG